MAYTAINKSTDYFNTKLYTGNGSQPRAITGVGHQPDFVWLKDRDTGYNYQLYDSVRGTSAGVLYSNASDAEDSAYQMSSFDSDGFTLGSNLGAVNENNKKIVSWNWKAGTSFSNSAGANGADIASSGSVNTTAGFSIIKATSDSAADKNIAHGLGVVPDVIFSKNLDSGYNWDIYFKPLGYNAALRLNSTNTGSSGRWGSSAFTANTFQTKESYSSANGSEYIYYCFASKTGFSKFGSYIGSNGQSHIYTGFKPRWCMLKRTDSTDNWKILDSKRSPFNIMNETLSADTSGAEATESDVYVDFMSNGIRLDGSNGAIHANQGNYVYMCFAEAPLVGSNNTPCTAR